MGLGLVFCRGTLYVPNLETNVKKVLFLLLSDFVLLNLLCFIINFVLLSNLD